ncbi:patatin-like phospholipase family protein [bacterium]|nr:patatin-like phospholipase family protein [bacterium]
MRTLKYNYLFGGGAIRGAGHVGVIKALNELNIEPEILCGSSVGSIVASLLAVGYTHDELAKIFLSVNFELFRDISIGFNKKFALSKGDIFLDWFRELIETKFYGINYKKGKNPPITFKDLEKKLIIITTNMKDFSCCEFSTFETPDFEIAMAVRISCCMPGLMRAVNIDDKLLVDGDLMKGKPMWNLSKNLKNNKTRMLEIRLEGKFSGSDTNPLEYVNGIYSCMTYSETDFIKNLYSKSDNYDYLIIDTGNVIVIDFNYPIEKRQEIIDQGYNQTINYFKNYLPKKKNLLLNIYKDILLRLNNIDNALKKSKYTQVKINVGNLFILLSKENINIDKTIYKDICQWQELLYSNIKSGLLGYITCENKNTIISKLKLIKTEVKAKIFELNEYLEEFQ